MRRRSADALGQRGPGESSHGGRVAEGVREDDLQRVGDLVDAQRQDHSHPQHLHQDHHRHEQAGDRPIDLIPPRMTAAVAAEITSPVSHIGT